jgi:hypothetical protein
MAEDFVRVYVANGQGEAELIKMFLESNGLKVLSAGESAAFQYGLANTPMAEVDIFVPKSQAEAAEAAIQAMQQGDLEDKSTDEPEESDSPQDSES